MASSRGGSRVSLDAVRAAIERTRDLDVCDVVGCEEPVRGREAPPELEAALRELGQGDDGARYCLAHVGNDADPDARPLCTTSGSKCYRHEGGANPAEKCAWFCDVGGCSERATVLVDDGREGLWVCDEHAREVPRAS